MNKNRIKAQEVCPYTGHVIARHNNVTYPILPRPCTKHNIPEKWIGESETDYEKRVKPFVDAINNPHRTDFIPW